MKLELCMKKLVAERKLAEYYTVVVVSIGSKVVHNDDNITKTHLVCC